MSSLPADTEQLRRRNRELEILNTIAQELNRPVDLDLSLTTALDHVARLLDLHTGWIFLMDESTGVPFLAASQNLPPGLANAPERMSGSCYCLDTYRDGDLSGAANVNVVRCSRLKWLMEEENSEGLRYHASIPLYAYGAKLGMLNVASTDWRELSADDLRILYTIGDMLAIAIERARLFDRSIRMGAIEERNRLAREIHDTLAQGLAAIALRLETADALLDGTSPEPARRAIAAALEQTRASLEEARRSVLDLRAAPLERRSLAEALKELAAGASAESQVAVELRVGQGLPGTIDARIEAGLYRIAQEAVNNALRHASASQIVLRLDADVESLYIRVDDDGVGFDVEQASRERHGLVGMNERARLLGGRLEIRSAPREGTRVGVVVPRSV